MKDSVRKLRGPQQGLAAGWWWHSPGQTSRPPNALQVAAVAHAMTGRS